MSEFDEKPSLDMNVYKQLCKDLGDEDGSAGIVSGLLADFREDARRIIDDLKTSLEQSDAKLFQRSAHTLKSNSAMFGALKLSAMSKQLEEIGKNNSLEGALEKVLALEAEYNIVLSLLPNQ